MSNTPPPLDEPQKKALRRLAHTLKPVVMVGQAGVTPAVLAEADQALEHHELIKIRVRLEREARNAAVQHLCRATGAALVQRIGNVATLYRPNPERPRIMLPRARPGPARAG